MLRSLVVLIVLAGSAAAQAKKPEAFKVSEVEQAVIDGTNAQRKEKKLPELKMNPQLMAAARAHAANMAKQSKLAHELDGESVSDRVKTAKYKYAAVGENIAWNPRSAKDVVAGWMNSEGHRKNILNDTFTEIGVAVAKNANGEPYWVQVFGKPQK